MYTEIVRFRFHPQIAPSKCFEFLARLAEVCEGARLSDHNYFAICVDRNNECRVDLMMPSVFDIGIERLCAAEREGILTITHPKQT